MEQAWSGKAGGKIEKEKKPRTERGREVRGNKINCYRERRGWRVYD